MRYRLLILLIFLLTAIIADAQPIDEAKKKISPALALIKRPKDKLQESVFWVSTTDISSAKNFFRQQAQPVKILSENPHTNLLVISTTWKMIDSTLIFSPLVRFIEMPRLPKEELALNAFDNSVNAINLLHHRWPSINGNGLSVSVKENRFNISDIDFRGRYHPTSLGSNEVSPHATIMATILAGAGNSFYTGKGAAWGATISTSDFATLLPDTGSTYSRFNISVQNHSYGTDIENYYGADAAAYDATVIANPTLVHVFSAGNEGNRASSSGTYNGIDGLANLTGSFKMAKNIITVGAVDSFGIVAALSSKGPAYDGRIKPELVAFGQDGSSGAAAITSGIALLVQHAYKEKNNGQMPTAALVKSALINSANDIGDNGPDYISGYGNVNAYKAVNTILQQRYTSGNITGGATQHVEITVPPAARKLSITLCWTDPPAVANAARALINDLDMVVENVTTLEKWQPWVLSSFPHKDSLLLPARRTRDSLNNVEQITIVDPAPGNYRISISGYSIASGSQTWFATWQIDTADQFQWHYPTSSDNLEAGEKNIIRWSSSFDQSTTGQLEYSVDKGNTWSPLQGDIDLKEGLYQFQSPNIFSLVHFKMTINGQSYISDTSTISKALDVQVGFNCPDSVLLYWNKANGINSYRLWSLGGRYMEPFATVADSFIVVRTTRNTPIHYAVSPLFTSTRPGIRSHTIDYSAQGVDCYVKSFLADLVNNNNVLLTLEAGALHNVKEIVFEKMQNGTFTSLRTIAVNGNVIFNYRDSSLQKGSNIYRAAIILQNGQKIYTQPATVLYFDNSPYLLFPNPASRNSSLQVHMPDLQPRQLVLFDAHGRKIRQQTLTGLVTELQLSSLQKGLYFVLILKDGTKDHAGKLIVN